MGSELARDFAQAVQATGALDGARTYLAQVKGIREVTSSARARSATPAAHNAPSRQRRSSEAKTSTSASGRSRAVTSHVRHRPETFRRSITGKQ
jgi:hypothetical protein